MDPVTAPADPLLPVNTYRLACAVCGTPITVLPHQPIRRNCACGRADPRGGGG